MKRPICDFVKEYVERETLRFHMPGHKGKGDVEKYDVTEIAGADSLYSAEGIIRSSEEYASHVFGAHTFYSTEGSSHAIRAMLYLVSLYAKEKGEEPLVLAARKVHKAFLSAIALTDVDVEWIFPSPEDNYLSMRVSPDDLDMILSVMEKKPTAVYITSPDYLGAMSDVGGLAEICHQYGVLLLVDNAHGAYLKFLPEDRHPITLGADMCCDSAHKTFPVLTGGAYLHVSGGAPSVFSELAKEALALFGSTSPSYLVLQSLDAANDRLDGKFKEELSRFLPRVECLKERLCECGYSLYGDETLKITIKTKSYGYRGYELADILRAENVECEFADGDFLVLMLSPSHTEEELERLEAVLLSVERLQPIEEGAPSFSLPERVMSVREAVTSPCERVPVGKSVGRVLASPTVGCPPAVPIIMSGERIDEETAKCFECYGIDSCLVVK